MAVGATLVARLCSTKVEPAKTSVISVALRQVFIYFVFVSVFLYGSPASAEQSGYWELGAGISYLQSPYYLGSDESKNYVLPFPHILIRSERFSVDRNSVRGHVLSSDRFKFDISFGGSLKVDSEDSRLRQGMPDLDYIIESGPAMKWLLKGRFNGSDRITLDLPIRLAVATDFNDAETIGWLIEPTLHLHNVISRDSVWTLDNRLRLMLATRDYHDYLYSVDAAYVTADRPLYQAKQGFSGWQYRFTLRRRQAKTIMGFYVAYTNIVDATYRDSSLVVENYNLSGGVFISWVLGQGRL